MPSPLQNFLNSSIANVVRMVRPAHAGDLFGVELECEGRNVDWDGTPNIVTDWTIHADGSLRGNHGSACEWVFNGPAKYKKSVERIETLFNYFEARKAKLVTSNRTSTHVHFNMGDKYAYQLVNMFILFAILEDILDRYCGEDRNGNLFCLSSRHAEEQVGWMLDACFKNYNFNTREDRRYCSFNFAAVAKFGTVEFRGMRGLDNREAVLEWLSILNEFCDYACYKMRNPVDIVEGISMKTPTGFIKEIFSKENANILLRGLSEQEINHSVFEGVRLIQMLAYKVGTEFDQVRLRGRDFWASFKDDAEPIRDVDPKALGKAEKMPRPIREGRIEDVINEIRERQLQPIQLNQQQMRPLKVLKPNDFIQVHDVANWRNPIQPREEDGNEF